MDEFKQRDKSFDDDEENVIERYSLVNGKRVEGNVEERKLKKEAQEV